VILEAGVVRARLDRDGSCAVGFGHRGRVPLAAAAPTGDQLPVLLGDGGGLRDGAVNGTAEQCAHSGTLGEMVSRPVGTPHDTEPSGSGE
jgi:hypothetical protein